MRRLSFALIISWVYVACGIATGNSRAGGTAPTTTLPNSANPALACALTKPDPAFLAPTPFPSTPPARYASAWYGGANLWTMISLDGETWHGLPHTAQGLTQKTFWWSSLWSSANEPRPAVTIVGQRLDAPGGFRAGPGTNASADFGTAMLVGIDIPSPGCWKLTATYRGAQLSYVVLVG